jgi:hypothetical protein
MFNDARPPPFFLLSGILCSFRLDIHESSELVQSQTPILRVRGLGVELSTVLMGPSAKSWASFIFSSAEKFTKAFTLLHGARTILSCVIYVFVCLPDVSGLRNSSPRANSKKEILVN